MPNDPVQLTDIPGIELLKDEWARSVYVAILDMMIARAEQQLFVESNTPEQDIRAKARRAAYEELKRDIRELKDINTENKDA